MVRVLVAEDEEPMRTSICELIGAEAGLELAGTAADVHSAIELARTTRPDVALLDVRIPGVDAPRLAREIRAVSPGTRVLALAVDGDRANLLDMLRAGAIGFLGRTVAPAEIVDAIHRACRGQASLSAVSAFELASLADREARGRLDHRRAARRAVLTRLVASEEEERRRIAAGHSRRLDPGDDRGRHATPDSEALSWTNRSSSAASTSSSRRSAARSRSSGGCSSSFARTPSTTTGSRRRSRCTSTTSRASRRRSTSSRTGCSTSRPRTRASCSTASPRSC